MLRNCALQMGRFVMDGLSYVTRLTSLTLDNVVTTSSVRTRKHCDVPCLHPVAYLHDLQQLTICNMQLDSAVEDLFAGK